MNPLPSAFNEAVFAHRACVVSVEGGGSGFLMGSALGRSVVMTCYHAVRTRLTEREVTVVVPFIGSCTGKIVFDDEATDIALIMLSKPIPDEPLEFSNEEVAVGRPLVMLSYFHMGNNLIFEPGTSHGYAKEPTEDFHHLWGSYTSQKGNSGSPVLILEDGGNVRVAGMHFRQTTQTEDGIVDISRAAITVSSIISCMRNKLGPQAEQMTIREMVMMIVQTAVHGPLGGANG